MVDIDIDIPNSLSFWLVHQKQDFVKHLKEIYNFYLKFPLENWYPILIDQTVGRYILIDYLLQSFIHFSRHHEYQFLDLSAAMTRSGVTCICPKPRYTIMVRTFLYAQVFFQRNLFCSLLSGWFLPLEPFSTQMWITESVTFVSVFLAITITKLCRGNARTQQNLDVGSNFLQTLAMFMLQSTKIVWGRIWSLISKLKLLISNWNLYQYVSLVQIIYLKSLLESLHCWCHSWLQMLTVAGLQVSWQYHSMNIKLINSIVCLCH